MVHRDPQTGKFVSDQQGAFDDIEVANFELNIGIEAANLSGGTGFGGGDSGGVSGEVLIDYDEIVDRNAELVLLEAHHLLVAYINSTETADGTLLVNLALTASPTNELSLNVDSGSLGGDVSGNAVGGSSFSDSIDPIGRYLSAVAHAPMSDGASGVGGAGTAAKDEVHLIRPPAEMGRFHPRDELFANTTLTVWNVDDAGVHTAIYGQHIYGVLEA